MSLANHRLQVIREGKKKELVIFAQKWFQHFHFGLPNFKNASLDFDITASLDFDITAA
jgi:hypothetical protein